MSKNNLSQAEFERIESYLLKTMSFSDMEKFEQEMESNPELTQNVQSVKLRIEAVQDTARRKKVESYHAQLNTTPVKSIEGPFSRLRVFSVAASIAVLVGIGAIYVWINGANKTDQLYAEYFKKDPGLITPMSTDQNYEFYRGMIDYKQGKYDLAIDRWEKLLTIKPDNDSLNYFIGLSLMAKENVNQAIPYLNKASTQTTSGFISETYYYLGLAELKSENINKAIEALEKSDSSKAKDLLKKLKQ